jgi:signal transduction histidine kinase/DNA-binding NarL/FixJ family response regulator
MKRQPFGSLEDGRHVDEINGRLVVGPIEYMRDFLAKGIEESASEDTPPEVVEREIKKAHSDALDRLAEMLNAAIPDERFHVTPSYLLDDGNNYSVEFWLFTVDYCRVISGDPDFYANSSQNRIPSILVRLFRPMSTEAIFRLLPQIVRKMASADVRTVELSSTSARMRWFGARQDDPLLNELHLTLSSQTYKKLFSSIPSQIHGQPEATCVETSSMLEGADYYEWLFSWQPVPAMRNRWLLISVFGAAIILASHLWIGFDSWVPVLLIVATLSLLLLGWSIDRFNKSEFEHSDREILLQEQRSLAEEQYDQSQETRAQLQALNVDLRRRVDEFAALHDISVAISDTLDLDELIERSLIAVTSHLRFDRALALLVDEDRRLLSRGQGVGGSAKMQELVKRIEISLDEPDNYFVELLNSDKPMLITGIPEDEMTPNAQLARALGVEEHLGTPLISKGRKVGILDVDNNLSQRPISEEDMELIFVVAGQIAVAIDNAILYREVESQKQTLEQRVAQRTEELAEATAEAQRARAVAEEASRAKSAFLSNVSHELRTPLTSVLGFTKIIGRSLNRHILPNVQTANPKVERATRNVQENLGIIVEEGERLTALINDVLDLAKIEAGKVEWVMQPVQIAPIIAHAASATHSLSEQKQLRLISDVEEGLPELVGDRNRLIQVVINLLSNAFKFTDEGTVTCRARQVDGEIQVSVIDTGIGIPQTDLEDAFGLFKQVGDTLTEKPTGSGLGLAISKEIVEYHGGRIWAESEPGQGSTFSFSLPIFGDRSGRMVSMAYDALVESLDSASTSGSDSVKRILVVDDEEAIRKYLTQELESSGYLVMAAASGPEALELLEADRPDLIIMDLLMPGLDGYKTLAAIRRQPAMLGVPALVLSVMDASSEGYGLGISASLAKPIDIEKLMSRIGQLLQSDPASHKVLVVGEVSEQTANLTEALNKRGYETSQRAHLSLGPDDETIDIVLVRGGIAGADDLLDRLANDKRLATGLLITVH